MRAVQSATGSVVVPGIAAPEIKFTESKQRRNGEACVGVCGRVRGVGGNC